MNKNKKELLLYGLVGLVLIVGITFSAKKISEMYTASNNHPEKELSYKIVEIQKGDTLWSIAKENYEGFPNIKCYIKELKLCNQLKTDRITTGKYLVVPYYEIK